MTDHPTERGDTVEVEYHTLRLEPTFEITDKGREALTKPDVREQLRQLIGEYMNCNRALGYAKIDGGWLAGGPETEKRNAKANEICTFLMVNWYVLFPAVEDKA